MFSLVYFSFSVDVFIGFLLFLDPRRMISVRVSTFGTAVE